MSGRGVLVLVAAAIAVASAAPPGQAQPPVGIVRPGDESGLSVQELGAQLYAGNCASCHGVDGRGVVPPPRRPGSGAIEGAGPPLRGVGARAADFYLRTGYMPLARVGIQPRRSHVLFDPREIRALVAYVASLGGGPLIPKPRQQEGSLSEG